MACTGPLRKTIVFPSRSQVLDIHKTSNCRVDTSERVFIKLPDVLDGWTVYTSKCKGVILQGTDGESYAIPDDDATRENEGRTSWRLKTSKTNGVFSTEPSNLYGDVDTHDVPAGR